MSVQDRNIHKDAYVARECIPLLLGTTAISQTDKETDSTVVGYPFEIERIEVNALTVTATISVNVLIGSTSALASVVTPVAATPTAGTLSTTLANIRGSATDELVLQYTSNGSGAATNGIVRVWVRPIPLNGEVYST